MNAEVAFAPLIAAARALKHYTVARHWWTTTGLLHLYATGDTLTLAATTGEETAAVPLAATACDGRCAVPPDALINGLRALKPTGRTAGRAVVTLRGDQQLHLRVDDGPTIDLDISAASAQPPADPAPTRQLVTAGPVADWCDLVAGVACATSQDPTRPELAVVRLLRDHPRVVLLLEGCDGHRIHRGTWGEPAGEPIDQRMPAEAAGRAVRLLRALDPTGHVCVYASDGLAVWRTQRVHLSVATESREYPNLEKIREDVLTSSSTRFTVDRVRMQTVLGTAQRLTAAIRHPRIRFEHHEPATVDAIVASDAGTTTYTARLAIRDVTGPAPRLLLNPDLIYDAVTFIDGEHITVHSITGRLPVYLAGNRRHAIVMQVLTPPPLQNQHARGQR